MAVTYAVCDLSRRNIEQYYCGFANQALWPICHYRLDLANLSEANAVAYFRVNEHFARQLHKLLRRDDMIWVTIISFPWRVFCARWAAPAGLVFSAHSVAWARCCERHARLPADSSQLRRL